MSSLAIVDKENVYATLGPIPKAHQEPKTLSSDDRWTIMELFVKEKGLTKHHIDSFNAFITRTLRDIIFEEPVIETSIPGYKIVIKGFKLGDPLVREIDGSINRNITPMECRHRDITYAIPLYVTFVPYENNVPENPVEIMVGEIPLMVKSFKDPLSKMEAEELVSIGEDPKDPGGYFIIDGTERIMVAQEDLAPNRVIVDYGQEGLNVTHTAKVISSTIGYRIPIILDRHKDGTLHVSFPAVPGKIPLVVLMRALGLDKDIDIALAVSPDPEIQRELFPSFIQASDITTVEDAQDYIGSRIAIGQARESRIERAKYVLDRYFLPHLGTSPEDRIRKALYLGQMACKLIELVLGRRPADDKDHYANKRIKLAGDMLALLFRVAWKAFLKDLRYQVERAKARERKVNLALYVRSDIITERIKHAMATGTWIGGRTGVTQIIDRTNWLSSLSHMRRSISPLSRSQPHFEARDLHGTQFGRLCPFETPEGPNCGLVKNLALSATITVGVDERHIGVVLYKLGVVPVTEIFNKLKADEISYESINAWSKVYLNGTLIGYHPRGEELVANIREMRRRGEIHYEVGVAYYRTKYINEVYINCDAGRIVRPLFVVKDGGLTITKDVIEEVKRGKLTLDHLLKNGYVELLDAEEEENALISINPEEITSETTHVEIWPPAIFGVAASTIPYAEHNQSPRNTYQSAMAKQALGFYMANFVLRVDTRAHLLHYPQVPLVQTRALSIMGYNDRPAGQNLVVAVMSYTGYNIEDAIIMNKSSVDRGLARSSFFRLYNAEELRHVGGQEDRLEIPDPKVIGYRGKEAYAKLEEDGIAKVELEVKGGEVIVGKTSPPRFVEEYKGYGILAQRRKDSSVTVRHGEVGWVDVVFVTTTRDGDKLVKVRVRDLRVPEIGDKFASRHGQKGVIGAVIPQHDMPYTPEGITPDLIINPHALPSRMTLGQLMESIGGKVAALRAKFVDGTPFLEEPIEELKKQLFVLGYPMDGTEPMYDGRTSDLIGTPVFIGIVYYQKLHHMVADKIHARSKGPVQLLTRQPTEGRAREGGLRLGEMERDAIVGHGASALLRERMLESSDKTIVYVCEICGFIGWYNRKKEVYECPIHKDKGLLHPVVIPYAFKLLIQELMSMGIKPKFIISDKHGQLIKR
ncbi:MAG: DNA-directed RNA polymerase subunit B [Ignisphaera sp.]|uniref:DNA-directed RNA polymerase subunit beta n=1 Tax=Ignisphaera aggregans TaxID=334771 RepID=A0A7C4JJ48_9CREN